MSDTINETAAAATATLATKVTNIGAATAVAGGFFAENWVSLIGLGIALAGFLVNWYYRHKEYKYKCYTKNAQG